MRSTPGSAWSMSQSKRGFLQLFSSMRAVGSFGSPVRRTSGAVRGARILITSAISTTRLARKIASAVRAAVRTVGTQGIGQLLEVEALPTTRADDHLLEGLVDVGLVLLAACVGLLGDGQRRIGRPRPKAPAFGLGEEVGIFQGHLRMSIGVLVELGLVLRQVGVLLRETRGLRLP